MRRSPRTTRVRSARLAPDPELEIHGDWRPFRLLVAPLGEVDVLELERLLVERRCVAHAGALPRGRRRRSCSSSRSASPSSVWCSTRKWPPQLLLAVSASRHISSPNSRKSATRPAFSSDWLSVVALAGHPHVGVELLAQRGDLGERLLQADCWLRAMPQLSHRMLPSSRWKWSTECVPLTDSSRRVWSVDRRPRPSRNAGSSVAHRLAPEQRREVVADRGRQHEVAVGQALHERARRRGGWRPGRRSSPRRARRARARCSSGRSRPRARPSCSGWRGRCASGTLYGFSSVMRSYISKRFP